MVGGVEGVGMRSREEVDWKYWVRAGQWRVIGVMALSRRRQVEAENNHVRYVTATLRRPDQSDPLWLECIQPRETWTPINCPHSWTCVRTDSLAYPGHCLHASYTSCRLLQANSSWVLSLYLTGNTVSQLLKLVLQSDILHEMNMLSIQCQPKLSSNRMVLTTL